MSSVSNLAAVAAQREKQALTPAMIMGSGIGAGYGMGSAPEGETLANVTHHGVRGLGAGAGAMAGAGLGTALAKRLIGNKPLQTGDLKGHLGVLAAVLAGAGGGGYLGNRLTKKLLGASPGERENEREEKLQSYLRKVSADLLEKEAISSGLMTKALSSALKKFTSGNISWNRVLKLSRKIGARDPKIIGKNFKAKAPKSLLNQRRQAMSGSQSGVRLAPDTQRMARMPESGGFVHKPGGGQKGYKYADDVYTQEQMEKDAFKGFGYLDDIIRGGGKALKWLGQKGVPSAAKKTKDFFKGPRGPVGDAVLGVKGYKPGPLPKLRSIASRVPGAGVRGGGPQTTSSLLGELAGRGGRGAMNLGTRARHFLHQPGQGLLRTLGKGGLLAGGGLAAKDLATLPFGGWASKTDKGGMRRGGLDYQRQAINPANVGAASAAINAMFSPLKSMASLPFGDADASPVGYKDKFMGQSEGGVRRYQRTPYAVGPLAKRKQRELAEAQKAYDALRSGKKTELEKARSDYAGGAYPELEGYDDLDPKGRRNMQRSLAQARINKLKAELGSGDYGGTTGWFTRERPSAAELGKTIGEREEYLRDLGLGGGGGDGSGLWQSADATADSSRDRVLRELGY